MNWRCSEETTKAACDLFGIHSWAILNHRGNNVADSIRLGKLHQIRQPANLTAGAIFHAIALFDTHISRAVVVKLVVGEGERSNTTGDIRKPMSF
jgi:hypothetical protein